MQIQIIFHYCTRDTLYILLSVPYHEKFTFGCRRFLYRKYCHSVNIREMNSCIKDTLKANPGYVRLKNNCFNNTCSHFRTLRFVSFQCASWLQNKYLCSYFEVTPFIFFIILFENRGANRIGLS